MEITKDGVLKKVNKEDAKDEVLTIPDGVITIGSFSMENASFFKEIIIPPSVKLIQSYCMKGHGPTKVVVPSTVKKVEDRAFEGARDLVSLEFSPDTEFTEKAFYWCPKLQKLKVGLINYNIRCLELGVPHIISSKKEYSLYQVYLCTEYHRNGKEGEKFYCVQKRSTFGSGATLRRAIEDCEKRFASPDVKKAYANITLDTRISSIDFRRITGACDKGVMAWMEAYGYKEDEEISVREILTKLGKEDGKYVFAQFIADRYADRAKGGNNE